MITSILGPVAWYVFRGILFGVALLILAEASHLTRSKGWAKTYSAIWWVLVVTLAVTVCSDCIVNGMDELVHYLPFGTGVLAIFLGWGVLRQIGPIKTAIYRREATLNMERYMNSDAYKAMGEFRDEQFRQIEEAQTEDKFRELEGREDAGQASYDLIMENIRRQDG